MNDCVSLPHGESSASLTFILSSLTSFSRSPVAGGGQEGKGGRYITQTTDEC